MQKNRVKQALAFHWFGLGSNFRINRLLNETLIKKDNKLECLLSEEEIMTLLELVPLANPISRTHSFEDECFERLIPYLLSCKYDKPFKYLNTYGWLEKTFFEVLVYCPSSSPYFPSSHLFLPLLNLSRTPNLLRPRRPLHILLSSFLLR